MNTTQRRSIYAAFLKKIGVAFANCDIKTEGSKESKEAKQAVLAST